jgi:hypothetical protein
MADRPIIRELGIVTCGAHGLTAVVPFVSSVEPAEACPPSPRLRHAAHRLWPTGRRTPVAHSSTALSILRSSLLRRTGSCGFLRRRVKGFSKKALGGSMFRLNLMTTGLLNDIR